MALCSSSSSYSSIEIYFNFKKKTNHIINARPRLTLRPSNFVRSSTIYCRSNRFYQSISSLGSIKPYVQSEWKPILKGWLCSAVSVYSLSQIVPRIGNFSVILSDPDVVRLSEEGLVVGLLFLVRLVANYWQQAFLWDAALNSVYKVRVHVFERVLQRDLGFFEAGNGVSSGDIAYRITAEALDVADTVYAILNTIIPSTLQLSAMATQMLVISPSLSLISALVIPSMALVIAYLGEKLHKISKKAHLSIGNLSAYLNEVLPSIFFVKANNAELCESARFQWLAHVDLSECLRKKKMKALIPQIVHIIYFGALFIFCVGSMVVSSSSFNCSGVVSFITSLVLLIEPIQGVGKAYNELKQGEPAIERLFDLTRFKSQVIEKSDAIYLDSVKGEVKFCDISFRYRDNMPLVLNGLDIHISAGETVALVGPSGGGKTTLVKLLLRLYDPICGTVAENIGYRDLMAKIDMERVELAAETANADDFIKSLPEQYGTNIGTRGSILSGGQKQRLAIARTVYQNPSILILDEATSALDSRSEFLVRQALQRLMENRTVLVIAHRLETVLMAERVLLLNDGKLQELTRSSLLVGQQDLLASTGLVI
ncbi:ABC transporter B family member 29, chloroplastic isoform X2 [Cornus florida]|uniref:ABC transporter B family member 29, chloroplastic isoform X2 n=1 Tax=Cornus florida TaxID=4283 RepID=UPI00289A36ED|nr:ABC transporter B family member 29, chloroplastic isoform X2 [Cornus florida]